MALSPLHRQQRADQRPRQHRPRSRGPQQRTWRGKSLPTTSDAECRSCPGADQSPWSRVSLTRISDLITADGACFMCWGLGARGGRRWTGCGGRSLRDAVAPRRTDRLGQGQPTMGRHLSETLLPALRGRGKELGPQPFRLSNRPEVCLDGGEMRGRVVRDTTGDAFYEWQQRAVLLGCKCRSLETHNRTKLGPYLCKASTASVSPPPSRSLSEVGATAPLAFHSTSKGALA